MEVKPGLVLQNTYKIPREYAAKHIGSGDVEVLATPAMILFMENTCRVGIDQFLPPTQTTVGTHVDVYHVNPAPVGAEIEIHARLLQVDGRRLIFYVEARLGEKIIGYGVHERYIVDREKFLEKMKEKI